MKISSSSRNAYAEPYHYSQTHAQQSHRISWDRSHYREGDEYRAVSLLQVIATVSLVLSRTCLERINVLMFISGYHGLLWLWATSCWIRFTGKRCCPANLKRPGRGDGALGSRPNMVWGGSVTWQCWVIRSPCFMAPHRGQIKPGANSSEAHRRFCWNPSVLSPEGQVETTAKGSVGWEKSEKCLYSVYTSGGLGTQSCSEA